MRCNHNHITAGGAIAAAATSRAAIRMCECGSGVESVRGTSIQTVRAVR